MFKPTHIVNSLEDVSCFQKGDEVMYFCEVEDHTWFSVKSQPHPVTGLPCRNAVYVNIEGLEQNIASYAVDEIKEN